MKNWIGFLLVLAAPLAQAQDVETKKLDFLVGAWTSKETIHAPSGQKIDFELKGTAKWMLENRAVVIDESFETSGQKVSNHIVVRYDARNKAYRLWWFSNTMVEPMAFTGDFKGDKQLIFVSEAQTGGFARQPHRITYNLVGDGRFDATLEVQYGEKWTLLTEAKYTRNK